MLRILYLIIGLLSGVIGYGLGGEVIAKLTPDIKRAEVAQAFQQRDEILLGLVNKIKQMEGAKNEKATK